MSAMLSHTHIISLNDVNVICVYLQWGNLSQQHTQIVIMSMLDLCVLLQEFCCARFMNFKWSGFCRCRWSNGNVDMNSNIDHSFINLRYLLYLKKTLLKHLKRLCSKYFTNCTTFLSRNLLLCFQVLIVCCKNSIVFDLIFVISASHFIARVGVLTLFFYMRIAGGNYIVMGLFPIGSLVLFWCSKNAQIL